MRKEDKRSKFAAEYALELQINELTFQLARTKKNDLDILRREEAIRKVEERTARQRAERVEERRKKSELLLRQIENDELTLSGKQRCAALVTILKCGCILICCNDRHARRRL